MLGFELTDLELDHDVSELLDVEEHEIGVVVGSVDVEVALSADEGEPASELQQRSCSRSIRARSTSRSLVLAVRVRKSKK